MVDLTQKKGTIAYVLNQHNAEISANSLNWRRLKAYVLSLLDKEANNIEDKKALQEAKLYLAKANSESYFMNLFTTYYTGMSCDIYHDKRKKERD